MEKKIKSLSALVEDSIAKGALVLMLVSFKGHWEYPVGYILIDKIDGDTLNSLFQELLIYVHRII